MTCFPAGIGHARTIARAMTSACTNSWASYLKAGKPVIEPIGTDGQVARLSHSRQRPLHDDDVGVDGTAADHDRVLAIGHDVQSATPVARH